jgi:hypothetical protein
MLLRIIKLKGWEHVSRRCIPGREPRAGFAPRVLRVSLPRGATTLKWEHMLATPYGLDERAEALRFIPAGAERILDIGCGHGAFSKTLRAAFPWSQRSRHRARSNGGRGSKTTLQSCDRRLLSGRRPTGEQWNVIVFKDVLQRLVDPRGH